MVAHDQAAGDFARMLTIAAVIAFSAVAAFGLGIEPILAQQLSSQLGLHTHEVGTLLSAEFLGSMAAALPACFWCRREQFRRVAFCGGVAFAVANLASAIHPRYVPLLVLRPVAGFAAGLLLTLTLTIAAQARQPARLFGLWVLGQTLTAVPGLLYLPSLPSRFALQFTYGVMGLGMLMTLPLARGFELPRSLSLSPASFSAPQPRAFTRVRSGTAILLSLFLLYTVASGAWAFAGQRAHELHFSAGVVGRLFAGAYLISAAGAAISAWLGTSTRCRQLALVGYALLGLAILLFALDAGFWVFSLFAILLQLTWAFTAPLVLAQAARVAPSSAMMAPANFVLGAGLGAGPLLAGFLFETELGVRSVALASEMLLALGIALLGFHPRPVAPEVAAARSG